MDRRGRICQHMMKLGVPIHLKGYRCLVEAVGMLLTCPELANKFTTVLYPTVGQRLNTSSSRVERAIRHAIEYVFINTNVDVLYEYFGNSIDRQRGKATNSQFIMTVAECIRTEEQND